MAIFDKFFKSVFRPQDERISIFGKNKHWSVPLTLQNYFNTFLIWALSFSRVERAVREKLEREQIAYAICHPIYVWLSVASNVSGLPLLLVAFLKG